MPSGSPELPNYLLLREFEDEFLRGGCRAVYPIGAEAEASRTMYRCLVVQAGR
ncbi:MAG: hypothetical protein ABR609_01310 [Acidimicrobiia bacterium]